MSDTASRIRKLIESPLFPLTPELTLKVPTDEMKTEIDREGEGARPCHSCNNTSPPLWTDGRWKITQMKASANPVMLFLETVEHLDFEDFDEAMAAEFGVLTWKLERAISTLSEVGRVHIHRWADGSSHFHVWFQGRPARKLEFYGWGNVLWSQLVDPLPSAVVDANHSRVIDAFTKRT